MRNIVALALASIALAACANDRDRQIAAVHCQEVGITPSSVEYSLCTQAYMRQAREQALNTSYHYLTAPAPNIYHDKRGEPINVADGIYGPSYP